MAAGVLVTTLDETKRLPTRIITFPMSAVSRGLQAGMRLQQNIAEMAIKGDEFFAPWCDKPEEQPEWARFDEDDEPAITIPPAPKQPAAPAKATKRKPARKPAVADSTAETDPPNAATGRFALYSSPPADLAAEAPEAQAAPAPAETSGDQPEIVDYLEYDSLTLAQLRAKLRGLGTDDLGELADYERAHKNRTPFVTMIDNRIASHQKKSGS